MALQLSMTKKELEIFVDKQLSFFSTNQSVSNYIDHVLDNLDVCFQKIKNKYYHRIRGGYFTPLHSAQYSQFLYFLSRTAYLKKDMEMAEKAYYLNKMMNSVDWFYEVELPTVFFADHPLGSVMGRAKYSNQFAFSQGCTVGGNHDIYPVISENVEMHAMSMIAGNCHIGQNVEIGAYAFVRDEDIPDNSIVFGQSPNLIIVTKDEKYMRKRLKQFE